MIPTLVCIILLTDLSSGIRGRRQEICEVEESHILLTSDLPVAAHVCRTPGAHPLLGEGYMCVQNHLSLAFSGNSVSVPSGCSLSAVDSLRAELSPLAVDDLRFQDLELSSGLQIVAEHRFCKSLGENNGRHRLDGREYFCHQQHLAVKTDPVSTLLPSGCVCYLRLGYPTGLSDWAISTYSYSSAPATATTTTLLFLLSSFSYYCH